MALPLIEDVRRLAVTEPPEVFVANYVFGEDTYFFRHDPGALDSMQRQLAEELTIERGNIVVVGSAKLGVSLSPDTFPRRFGPNSDIDVAIIDRQLFDLIWTTVLRWNYPRRYQLGMGSPDLRWARARQADVYWGWFKPDRIRFDGLAFPEALRPVRDLGARWFGAFRGLSRINLLADRDVSGRLYRTWRHALLYHAAGIAAIQHGRSV